MKPVMYLMAFAALILVSCNSDVVYKEKYKFPEEEFTKGNPIDYTFEIQDTSLRYDIMLDLHHSDEYAYQNLYVKITTVFPDGKKIDDVVSLELSKSGTAWQGECGGGECKVPIVLIEKTKFKLPGKYKISLEQYGRTTTVSGLKCCTMIVRKEMLE